MDQALDDIACRWRLSSRDQARLAHTAESQPPCAACLDIDRALLWLLGDRELAQRWLRTPHPALYHATPLAVALGSGAGRAMLRTALLEEAAQARDPIAAIAKDSN